MLTLSLGGANFTGVPPALTWHSSTAANLLGRVLRLRSLAASIFKLCIAVVHTEICQWTHIDDKMDTPNKLYVLVLNHEGENPLGHLCQKLPPLSDSHVSLLPPKPGRHLLVMRSTCSSSPC